MLSQSSASNLVLKLGDTYPVYISINLRNMSFSLGYLYDKLYNQL